MSEYVTDDNTIKKYADRMVRIMDTIDDQKEDLKEIKAEAKSEGVDVAALTKVVGERNKDRESIEEREQMIQIYRDAVA